MRRPLAPIREVPEPSSTQGGADNEIAALIEKVDSLGANQARQDVKIDELIAAVATLQSTLVEMRQCILFSKPPEVAKTYEQFADVFGDCLPLATDDELVKFDGTLASAENSKLLVSRYPFTLCVNTHLPGVDEYT